MKAPPHERAQPRFNGADGRGKMLIVGPVGVVALVGLRRRWRTLVALTILLALVGGVTLASIAGSRRGRSALDGFLAYSHPGSIQAVADPALPAADQQALLDAMVPVAGGPVSEYALVIVRLPNQDLTVAEAQVAGSGLTDVSRPILVDGRLPLERGEAAVNESLARRQGIEAGDILALSVFQPGDTDVIGNGDLPDPKQTITVTVGAIVRIPLDLVHSPEAQEGTIYEAQESRLLMDQGFWEDYGPDLASYGLGLLADPPPADHDQVVTAMREAGGPHTLVTGDGPEDLDRIGSVRAAIDLEANALLALAALVLVFGLGLVGTALARVTAEDDGDRRTLIALGLSPRQVLSVRLTRAVGTAVVAALGAVIIAVPASALFPIGLAGDAEIDPGVDVDALVLGVGAVAFAVLVLGRLAISEWAERRSRTAPTRRAFRVGTAAPAVGPAVGLGIQLSADSLTARRGSARASWATAVVGVVAVVGAATFAASLDRLVESPELQGFTWDLTVGNYSDPARAESDRGILDRDPDVDTYVGYNYQTVSVDGRRTTLAELDDGNTDVLPVVLEGRAPVGDHEVALGRDTLATLGKELGDTVEIGLDAETTDAEVVGVVVAPAVLAPTMDLDSGGVVTFALPQHLVEGRADLNGPVGFLVRLRDGVDRQAATDDLFEHFGGAVLGPTEPLDVDDLQRVERFPYALAAMLGTLALASVVVALAATARHRRRDLAVVRSLGLDRRQLWRVIAAEATTFTSSALVVGIPVGIVAGRLAWRLAADGIGSEVGPAIPVLEIAVAAAVVLLAVNLYGRWLAHTVGARRPGADLRTE